MKKILMAVAIAGAFVAAPASAQWYVGAGVGSAQAKLGAYSPAANVNVTGTSNRDTAWKILGGYQFTPNWGAEMQYSDLGHYNYTLSQPGASATGNYKANQWSFAGTGTIPFGNFYGFGKLGISANHVSTSSACIPAGCLTNGSGYKSDLLAGVGVGYNFTKNIGLRLEYENFGKLTNVSNGGGSVKGEDWALSVKYSF